MTPEEQLRQALDLLREIRQLPAFDDGVYISSYGARLVERMDALLAGTAAPTPKKGFLARLWDRICRDDRTEAEWKDDQL